MRDLRNEAEDDLPGAPERQFQRMRPEVVQALKSQLGIKTTHPVHDPGHKNPPLQDMNRAYMAQAAKERAERAQAVNTAVQAVQGAFAPKRGPGRPPGRLLRVPYKA
jgi:hypothetical protein